MKNKSLNGLKTPASIGVGLRHQNYQDIMGSMTDKDAEKRIDFIEVHAENFYAHGGLALSLLQEINSFCGVSIHGTSLGLASNIAIPNDAIQAFKKLVGNIKPILVSDHASFSWSENNNQTLHSGDLLPFVYNKINLSQFCNNVDRVQQAIGRQLLIENLSSYLNLKGHTMTEFEFLQEVCEKSGSGILLDINNIYVNSINNKSDNIYENLIHTFNTIDTKHIKEIHLAGCTIPEKGDMMIDDHSQKVNNIVWKGYEYAINKFGQVPTLIEWDNELPTWEELTDEAIKARIITNRVIQGKSS